LASRFLLVAIAGEDGEARILGEAGIGEGQIAEEENGIPVRFDAAGMKAVGAETSVQRIRRLLQLIRHDNKDSAVC
jgi:hypothetical protein